MGAWGAAATLLIFPTPNGSEEGVPAFGRQGVFSESVFNELWSGFFGAVPAAATCGLVRDVGTPDENLIGSDTFLAAWRGIDKSLCQSSSWYVSGLRIDPCRLRSVKPNKTIHSIKKCSLNGKYSEVRVVLQPVAQHDRGVFFPDAAIHLSFSSPEMFDTTLKWRQVFLKKLNSGPRQRISVGDVKAVLSRLKENDAAVMLSDTGLSRWSFARAEYHSGKWKKVPLDHGGFHESLSDASNSAKTSRTRVKPLNPRLDTNEIFDPLKTHPLRGSCIDCHLADSTRPARVFRQLCWGLSGERVVSRRTLEEAIFSAQELSVIEAP